MNSRNHISDELKVLESELSPALNRNPYSVPDGYFEGLAGSILARIRTLDQSAAEEISELSPLLAGLSRNMPFEVPGNYFGQTAKSLGSITKEEDEESLVLSFISKEMPYEVPLGYFANFPDQVLEKLPNRRSKVVSMTRNKWMRMAVAAMFAGIMVISGFLYFNQTGNGSDPVASELKKASTEELDAFINSTTGTANSNTTQSNSVAQDVKEILDDVSDKELEAFLSAVPADDMPAAEEELDLLYN